MKLVSCIYQSEHQIGIVNGESVVLLSSLLPGWPTKNKDMLSIIDDGPSAMVAINTAMDVNKSSDYAVSLSSVTLLAPIPRPRKNIMCLGFNYVEHARESLQANKREVKIPEHPIVFTKSVSSVNGPYADIPYNRRASTQLDWEVELAVVIGKGGINITEENALDHVFGYSVINDISARDLQFRHKQFFLGKSLDGACPMGPWIVTADEIADPHALDLSCWVNGELKQSANTCQQLFKIAKVIEILSTGMTLEPGDIIATGTPSGVGFARIPPEFLQPDDIVECEIENIGRIKNRVVEVS